MIELKAQTPARVTTWPASKDGPVRTLDCVPLQEALETVIAGAAEGEIDQWWVDVHGGPTIRTIDEARHLLRRLRDH